MSKNETHVWKANTHLSPEHIRRLELLVSSEERQRAQRFQFDHLRRRYIVCRGLMRVILGWYTGVPSEQIEFTYRENGKPFLSHRYLEYDLYFNLSHSADMVVFGIAHCPWLGIDIQWIRPIKDFDSIANRYFYPGELEWMSQLTDGNRLEAFYRLWTCKEAYLKAIGVGLAGLEKIEILEADGDRLALHDKASAQLLSEWFLHRIEPAPGYAGAVALRGQDWHVECFEFPAQCELG